MDFWRKDQQNTPPSFLSHPANQTTHSTVRKLIVSIKTQILKTLQEQSSIPDSILNKINSIDSDLNNIKNGKYPEDLTKKLSDLNASVTLLKEGNITKAQFDALRKDIDMLKSSDTKKSKNIMIKLSFKTENYTI